MKSIQSDDNSTDVYTISKSSFNFEIKVKWLENEEYQLVQGTNQEIITYLGQEFNSSELDSISNIEIFTHINDDEQLITIAAMGTDYVGNSAPIATVFLPSDENPSPQSRHFGSNRGGDERHKCEGNPCACCKFIKQTTITNGYGQTTSTTTKIIGCECDTAASAKCGNGTKCNHSITSGG